MSKLKLILSTAALLAFSAASAGGLSQDSIIAIPDSSAAPENPIQSLAGSIAPEAFSASRCPVSMGEAFIDGRDNSEYKQVTICNQTWMAENLNYDAGGSACYNSEAGNCLAHGRLYSWTAAMTACPLGWHLPSKAEWDALIDIAGGSQGGAKLKSRGDWSANGGGSDEFGFAALPSGYSSHANQFGGIGELGYWWTSSEDGSGNAYSRHMMSVGASASENSYGKSYGFSVRCIKGEKAVPIAQCPAEQRQPQKIIEVCRDEFSESSVSSRPEEASDYGSGLGFQTIIGLNHLSFGSAVYGRPDMGIGFGLGALNKISIDEISSFSIGLNIHYKKLYSWSIDGYEESMTEFAASAPALFQFGARFYTAAGIQIDIPFSSKYSWESSRESGSGSFDGRAAADFGLVLGTGFYAAKNIAIDLRAVIGLSSVASDRKDKSSYNQYVIGIALF